MISKNSLAILIGLLFLYHGLFGQVKTRFDLQSFVERHLFDQDQSLSFEQLYERLLAFSESPLDLNQVDEEALSNLGLLSPTQIQTLIKYQSENGRILTPYELLYLDGFDPETVRFIMPFVYVGSKEKNHPSLLKRILSERNNYVLLRYERVLENKQGHEFAQSDAETNYEGSPNKIYLRYRVSKTRDFSIGFTSEKDSGEKIKWDPSSRRYGADFWSGHALVERQGKWRKVLVGDYQLQFGQALIFGSGFSVGKGSETVNSLERINRGVTPYTSVIEGGFLRGAAANYEFSHRLKVNVFLSNLRQDANIENGINSSFENHFSSIQLSGLHRTASEIENRKRIREKVYGIELSYNNGSRNHIALVAALNDFSTPVLKSARHYNLFEFSGKRNFNLGFNGNLRWKRFYFFGEVAISKSKGLGRIIGVTTKLYKRIDFGMIIRTYDRNFHSIKGSAFAEGSRNINESGTYWGLKYKLNKKFSLSAYYDLFSFPWLKPRANKPSVGMDYLIRLNYLPNSDVNIYFQYRSKTKEENESIPDSNKTVVSPVRSFQYLLAFQYKITNSLRGQTRIQASAFDINSSTTSGNAFIQDINYSASNLSISMRMAIFDTEGAKNRQYAYERDVLYAFSIPGYSGKGIRNYLLAHYRLNRQLDFWARISRTTFFDRNEIGTGLETIKGNKRTDVKFQIRYKIR